MYAGSAVAAPNNVGCGWGSQIFEGKKGMFNEIMAITTNHTSGSQSFGITTGTAGCAKDGVIQQYAAADAFITANMDKVAYDMSVGKGEALDTLATAMGIKEADKSRFFAVSKANFDMIYPSDSVSAAEVMDNLGVVLATDEKLSKYAA
ncbi:MAG: DUF3015 domain-containing protein [Gammaproteobacteria bacterium]|nr:DUF3015 domain-containing protein [Gammaproteobacteria bacterium]